MKSPRPRLESKLPLLLLVISLFQTISTAAHAVAEKSYEVGERFFIEASSEAHISLSPAKLVRVKETPKGLDVVGLTPGTLTVKVDHNTFVYNIMPNGHFGFFDLMKSKAQDMVGPKVSIQNGAIRIQGQLHRHLDWKAFVSLAEAAGHSFQLQTDVDQDVQKTIESEINRRLTPLGVSSYHFRWTPWPYIEFPKSLESREPDIRQRLSPTGIGFGFSDRQLNLEPLIKIKIVLAEVAQSFQSDIGVDWPNQFSAQIGQKFTGHADLVATLKLAEAQGKGQILAAPEVVARSGGEAEFLAGGELPIRVVGRFTKAIEWKRHGIFLKIQPKSDTTEHLSIQLQAEVSMPDSGMSIDNIPAMKTNRVSSQFDIKNNSTIVLSGLIQNMSSLNEQSLAGLSRLPLIGGFFKSYSKRKYKSELIIFVTPQIIDIDKNDAMSPPKTWEGPFEPW